jgi:aromatic ring hydroxylase
MGIRTGKEFVESLRDGRTIFVNGERIGDVTEYPPFRGTVATLASLYDLQNERRAELTFPSPKTGAAVSASFMTAETIEAAEFRARAEEIRAD